MTTYAQPLLLFCLALGGLISTLAFEGSVDLLGTLLAAVPLLVIGRRLLR